MNSRSLALIGTAAVAGGGGWQWIQQAAQQTAQFVAEYHRGNGNIPYEAPWRAERCQHPAPAGTSVAEVLTAIGMACAVADAAARWVGAYCRHRRNRSCKLLELDALAATALGPAAGEIAIAAAAHGVTTVELTQWAGCWAKTTSGPRHYTRNTR